MAAKKQKSRQPKDQKKSEAQVDDQRKPWLAYRTGIIIIAITSVGMAVLTFVQALQIGYRVPDAIFRAFVFGIMIWAIFFGYLYFTRWIRRL